MRSVLSIIAVWLCLTAPASATERIAVLFDISSSTSDVITGVTETLDTLAGRLPAYVTFTLIAWQSAVVAEAEWPSTERFSTVMTSPSAGGTELLPALERWYPAVHEAGGCPRAIIVSHGVAADATDAGEYVRHSVLPGAFLRVLVVPNGANGDGQVASYQRLVGEQATEHDFATALFSAETFIAAVMAALEHGCEFHAM